MDIKINYEEKGQGQPLILLHGNGENHAYFSSQLESYSKYFRVIAPDTRGHGQSPRGEAPFTIRQFAKDLKCFLDEMNIEKAHILGFSDGANIAMIFAMEYPQMVDKLILNGGNLNGRGVKPAVQLPIILGYKIAMRAAVKDEKALANAEMLGLMVNDPNIDSRRLCRIKAPTLVIAGNRDMIKQSHTKLIASSIPDARLSIIKGDHFVAAKNPEDFDRCVLAFLREGEV